MSPYTTPRAASAMGARWPRGGACSAAPITIVITRSLVPATAVASVRASRASASPPEAICQDHYDIFIGMSTSCVELCADSLSRDHVEETIALSRSRAGRSHEFKKPGTLGHSLRTIPFFNHVAFGGPHADLSC